MRWTIDSALEKLPNFPYRLIVEWFEKVNFIMMNIDFQVSTLCQNNSKVTRTRNL